MQIDGFRHKFRLKNIVPWIHFLQNKHSIYHRFFNNPNIDSSEISIVFNIDSGSHIASSSSRLVHLLNCILHCNHKVQKNTRFKPRLRTRFRAILSTRQADSETPQFSQKLPRRTNPNPVFLLLQPGSESISYLFIGIDGKIPCLLTTR